MGWDPWYYSLWYCKVGRLCDGENTIFQLTMKKLAPLKLGAFVAIIAKCKIAKCNIDSSVSTVDYFLCCILTIFFTYRTVHTVQKLYIKKFTLRIFKLRIWSNLLKKSLLKNFIFCGVSVIFTKTDYLHYVGNKFLPVFYTDTCRCRFASTDVSDLLHFLYS